MVTDKLPDTGGAYAHLFKNNTVVVNKKEEKPGEPLFKQNQDIVRLEEFADEPAYIGSVKAEPVGVTFNLNDIRIAQIMGITVENLADFSLELNGADEKEAGMIRLLMDEMSKMARTDAAEKGIYGPIFNFERLVSAYDAVKNDINSDNQKHSQFLDRAFASFSRYIAAQDMSRVWSAVDRAYVSHEKDGVNYVAMGDVLVEDSFDAFWESGRKQGQLFADTFLGLYKKNGAETSYKAAEEALMNMGASTSAKNIGYTEFLLLSANIKGGLFMWDNLFSINDGLSDFMQNYMRLRYAAYQDYRDDFMNKYILDVKA
jgi:hypothetical protein